MGDTNKVGDIGEALAISKMLAMGYKISIPFGHDHCYDFIADKDNELYRVQVKSLTKKNGVLMVSFSRTKNINSPGQPRIRYSFDEIDMFVVVDNDTGKCYDLPLSLFSEKDSVCLRIDETRNNQTKNIVWANDFLMDV